MHADVCINNSVHTGAGNPWKRLNFNETFSRFETAWNCNHITFTNKNQPIKLIDSPEMALMPLIWLCFVCQSHSLDEETKEKGEKTWEKISY